jgi:hypothetical protein
MKDCKIRTYGIAELSEKIQKELFRMGYKWKDGSKTIQYQTAPYLFVDGNLISYDYTNCVFEDSISPELHLEDLLAMEPEPKKRQEKFYPWMCLDKDKTLTLVIHLATEKGFYFLNGELTKGKELQQAISEGRAWKLNPDNPVVLEVEG